MKRLSVLCLVACLLVGAFSILADEKEPKQPPKLDCKKLVMEGVKALEAKDFKAVCRLGGEDYSAGEEAEAEFKTELDQLEQKGELSKMLDRLRLFPEIGALPSWVTKFEFECEYLEGDSKIGLQVRLEYKEDAGRWLIKSLEPDNDGPLDAKEKDRFLKKLSPAPVEGQKTIDAGINQFMSKFIAAIKENDLKTIHQCVDEKVEVNEEKLTKELKKLEEQAGGKLIELLSQLPTIGPIPGPARKVEVGLAGILDGKVVELGLEFEWLDGRLMLDDIDVRCKEQETKEVEKGGGSK